MIPPHPKPNTEAYGTTGGSRERPSPPPVPLGIHHHGCTRHRVSASDSQRSHPRPARSARQAASSRREPSKPGVGAELRDAGSEE